MISSSGGNSSSGIAPLLLSPSLLPLRLVVDRLAIDQEDLGPRLGDETWGGPGKAWANRTGGFWPLLAITLSVAYRFGLSH